jgi:hypothetical protein
VPLVEVEELGWCRVVGALVEDCAGRALSDFGDASTAALLRDVVKHGQVARDLQTDLDASAAALALLDTYLGTLYRRGPHRGNLRQQVLPSLTPSSPRCSHPLNEA